MGKAPRNIGLIRQWKIVRALQAARFGLTIRDLIDAAEQNVSKRTIYRDIDTLTLAGFPIDVKSGRDYACESKVYWREWTVN